MVFIKSALFVLAVSATATLASVQEMCEAKCTAKWGPPPPGYVAPPPPVAPPAAPPAHQTVTPDCATGAGAAGPFHFTSTFNVIAAPENVINAKQVAAPGQPGGQGWFNYGINSETETICYNITISGVTAPFSSPAKTATHIHEAAVGKSGPPRIAFPNPEPVPGTDIMRSIGCITGPFTTGIAPEGKDTGAGFSLKQIEANPAAFFTDTHTELFKDGAVRGQLA